MEVEAIVTEIKKLNEMDFTSLLESIKEHIDKNNWRDSVNSVFIDQDEIDDLDAEIDSLKDTIDSLSDDKKELKRKIEDIKRLIE